MSDVYPELVEVAATRRAQLVGSVALQSAVAIERIETFNPTTLLAALQEASFGNDQALRLTRTNVATDVAERLFKSGHQTEVAMDVVGGKLLQNGVQLTDVHKNTLEYTKLNHVMQKRTEHELQNAYLFEEMLSAGVFDNYDVVVFSPTPEDAQTRKDYNFYRDTDSLSIQYLKSDGQKVIMETAMVAGKKTPNSLRHDLDALSQLLSQAGHLDVSNENEALSHVLLVEKTEESGVHQIVVRYDELVGGTFYGEQKPQQDYAAYREVCRERTRSFEPIVDKIVERLLSEVASFKDPLDVIKRLDYLSDFYCLERATNDPSIDTRVFGTRAAAHIEQARALVAQGDISSAHQQLSAAKETSISSSCPLFKGATRSGRTETDQITTKAGEDKYGSLEFKCSKGHTNTRPRNKLIESCKTCGVSVKC